MLINLQQQSGLLRRRYLEAAPLAFLTQLEQFPPSVTKTPLRGTDAFGVFFFSFLRARHILKRVRLFGRINVIISAAAIGISLAVVQSARAGEDQTFCRNA